MEIRSTELADPLNLFPPVDFCCAYGSSLLSNNKDKTSMVDYIIGVADPEEWHSENFESNMNHYSRWMARLGPRKITWIADRIGVGVHFNPFVECGDKMIKYGVVRMHDLARDVLTWDRFYLSGRLQKPVKKIVQGSFKTFQAMYKPLLKEYTDEGLLECRYHPHSAFEQDCGLSATTSLFSSLPSMLHGRMLKNKPIITGRAGEISSEIIISSREQAVSCVRKCLRRVVLVSSARQAVSGLLATGGVNAACYVARKMSKACKSRTL